MHLPMTSIQEAWGVRTLDDRSDTSIPSRYNAQHKPRTTMVPSLVPSMAAAQRPQPPPPTSTDSLAPYKQPPQPYVHKSDDSELIGLLTMLLIFILIDKLLTIWNKS